MIVDALQWIKNLAAKERCRIHSQDGRSFVVFDGETGRVVDWPRDPGPWMTQVYSLGSLVDAVQRFDQSGRPAFWISHHRVAAVFNDSVAGHRDCRAILLLRPADVFTWLLKLENLAPRDLVWMLRFRLFATTQTPENLRDRVSVLKFASDKEAEHNNTGLDASVARSVRDRVTGASQLPEEVVFSFLPYPDLAAELGNQMVDVRCVVRVDIAAEKVSIIPLPEQMAAAARRGQQMLRDAIVAALPSPVTPDTAPEGSRASSPDYGQELVFFGEV